MNWAARFLAAFNPAPHIHGTYTTFGGSEPGKKWKGKAESVTTPITLEEVEQHLSGVKRIGFAPLHENGMVSFAAIDIDQYEGLDLVALAKKTRRLMLPLIICVTKSGGAHGYIFFAIPKAAGMVRERLSDWSAVLYPKGKVEIFPKQSKLSAGTVAMGNWINVPYFGDSTYALDENGEKLNLEGFLELVERQRALAEKALSEEDAVAVEAGELELDLAVAELLPHWTTDRHLLALTVAGALLRSGVAEDKVGELIEATARAAQDEEPQERLNCVGIAAKAIANNSPMFGIPALIKRLGRESAGNFLKYCGISDGGVLSEINEKYALIRWGGQARVMTMAEDPETGWRRIELMGTDDFKLWLANRPKVGKQAVANWWLKHPGRRQYEGVVFRPAGSAPSGYLNLWDGWAVAPGGPPEACEPWLDMVREVIASGNEDWARYILAWCADAIQNPTNRPGVTLVLRGKQGAGKGTFARIFGLLFGKHFLHLTHSKHLVGNFNSHLVNALLVFADEALYPGDKASEGALKALITEPSTSIEYKGKDVISVANHIRVVMASNHDWVVPASVDDRRFAVFDVDDKWAQNSAYFARINRAMLNGPGLSALMRYFMDFDLSTVDLRKIPVTRARVEQQLQSMDTVTAFLFEKLCESDGWAREVKTVEFMKEYREHAGKAWTVNETQFGIQLRSVISGSRKVRLKDENGARHRCYRFPDVDAARAQFEKAKGPMDWIEHERKNEDDIGAPF
jgi:hypothetical protein